jgi:hypothetical protein
MKKTMIRLALRLALLFACALPLTACYSYSYNGFGGYCESFSLSDPCH